MTEPQPPLPEQPFSGQPSSHAYQPYYGHPPQPPRKRPVWPWVLGVIALVVFATCGGCAVLAGGAMNEIDKAASEEHNVTYEVEGDGAANSITYSSTDSGGIEQVGEAELPWAKEVTTKGLFNVYALTAQRSGGDGSGSITCRILLDGKVLTEKTSSGAYAVVTCDADNAAE